MSHDSTGTATPQDAAADEHENQHGYEPMWRSLERANGARAATAAAAASVDASQKLDATQKSFDPPQRRDFLKIMGASLAIAGVSAACSKQPSEKIVPYAKNPEALIPGRPLFFATAMPWSMGALGLLVESHMGRPTKAEGNPDHPSSLGSTDVFAQGAVLGLYDPDRSGATKRRGSARTWDDFLVDLTAQLNAQVAKQGAGLRILTQTITSPTLGAQLEEFLVKFPKARWHQYEPSNRDGERAGTLLAFGKDAQARAQFDKADVVLSLGSDFLAAAPHQVRGIRDFASRRKLRKGQASLNRLYVVECDTTCTGMVADHRLALRSADIEAFARTLGRKLGLDVTADEKSNAGAAKFVEALARDLDAHKGSSLVVAGTEQPAAVHALAALINERLGNVGKTVVYTQPIAAKSIDQLASITELATDMRSGSVEALVILCGNPVYDSPADLDFGGALAKVPWRAQLSLYDDETSQLVDWHVHEAHFLESWSDTRSADGTLTIVQPLIAPLYGGKSAHEIVNAMLGKSTLTNYDALRESLKKVIGEAEFEKKWRRVVHDGVVPNTAFAAIQIKGQKLAQAPAPATTGLELVFRTDPNTFDGRFANNGWLQEQPRPMTKITWENVAQIAPATASRLGVENGDVLALELGGRKLEAPAWIVPGHAADSITLTLGFGRTHAGRVATGIGHDAYRLRTTKNAWMSGGLVVQKTGGTVELAATQEHDDMTTNLPPEKERRAEMSPVRVGTLAEYKANPRLFTPKRGEEGDTTLYAPHAKGDYSWGLVIDLAACTACGTCVTACSAENNSPVVGKSEVLRGREMHWMRIDRYYQGSPDAPRVHVQPVPCMHCENAPCETVCPVAATVHGPEGLNEMVYNRCIGTRYCSNNCPYKVRRFNFFLYSDYDTESLKMARNPDVTVRSRGVMEKCTYCVQRINQARLSAKREERKIREGEIRTACQSACPAQAITFGNIADPESAVAKLRAEPHQYALLEELNTRPRTTYLSKIMNPNPELEA